MRYSWFALILAASVAAMALADSQPYQPTDPFDSGSPEFPMPLQPASGRDEIVVSCESDDGSYRSCYPGVEIKKVQLERRLSQGECRQDLNWGYQKDFIWVDNGCRAAFRVSYEKKTR